MPRTIKLKTDVPWEEIRATDADWQRADQKEMVRMLHNINLIRAFEETVLELAGETLVHGPAHSSILLVLESLGDRIRGADRHDHAR